jgi:hypothetical protein
MVQPPDSAVDSTNSKVFAGMHTRSAVPVTV